MVAKSPILEAEDVTKIYTVGEVKIKALRGVSLKLHKGDFISITGKSGSGKSTLMHIIGLLATPSHGKVLLKGKDISSLDESSLAKIRNQEIGFVFQTFNLLQRTSALDNVTLPLKYNTLPRKKWQKRASRMLDIVGLSHRIHNKSNELSGGEKQRVAIARALVNNPSVILADEPTGNLDSKTGNEVLKLFKKLNKQGKTIVIVTHDEDIAQQTHKQIVLSDGKIIKWTS